jgi:hypothetical protein
MDQVLIPRTNLPLRIVALVVLVIPVWLIPGWPLQVRFFSMIMPLIFTGTYRISRIVETKFETQFFFAFIPFPMQKCKLATVGYIETVYGNDQPGMWTFILFGPLQFIMGFVFNYLLPAFGGPFEIWLVTAKGKEIKAWQGHNQDFFDKNLKLLQTHTTAELRGRTLT